MDKLQKSRYSQAELELIKKTFGGNDDLLYAIRNVFYQFPGEVPSLTDDVLAVVRKTIFPELTADVPLLQQADPYFNLARIQELNPGVASLHIQAKDIQSRYIEQQFNYLAKKSTDQSIKLADLKAGSKEEEARFVDMFAYLLLTNAYIDSCLSVLQTLANKVEETPEEAKKRLKANSNK